MSIKRTAGFVPRYVAAALVLVVGLFGSAMAGTVNEVDGFAIKGYDPVAYFTDNRAVLGSDAFTAQYNGATFKFASADHRDAFVANPAKYAPQYGGFCAYGVAVDHKAVTDPEAFTIVDGKLYLNYSKAVQDKWRLDIPGHITKADENWPSVSQSTEVIN